MIQVCPKGCHITNKGKQFCPRCRGFIKNYDEKDKNKILEEIGFFQRENGKSIARGNPPSKRFI